jgi:hypothetical protein
MMMPDFNCSRPQEDDDGVPGNHGQEVYHGQEEHAQDNAAGTTVCNIATV